MVGGAAAGAAKRDGPARDIGIGAANGMVVGPKRVGTGAEGIGAAGAGVETSGVASAGKAGTEVGRGAGREVDPLMKRDKRGQAYRISCQSASLIAPPSR